MLNGKNYSLKTHSAFPWRVYGVSTPAETPPSLVGGLKRCMMIKSHCSYSFSCLGSPTSLTLKGNELTLLSLSEWSNFFSRKAEARPVGQRLTTGPVSFPKLLPFFRWNLVVFQQGSVADMWLDPAPGSGAGYADLWAGWFASFYLCHPCKHWQPVQCCKVSCGRADVAFIVALCPATHSSEWLKFFFQLYLFSPLLVKSWCSEKQSALPGAHCCLGCAPTSPKGK